MESEKLDVGSDSLESIETIDTFDNIEPVEFTINKPNLAAETPLNYTSSLTEALEITELLQNDDNSETFSCCDSFSSCHSSLGSCSDSSYYSFDEDYELTEHDDVEQGDVNQSITTNSNNADAVIIRICGIDNTDDEETETDGKLLSVQLHNSEEAINKHNLWSDSNSVSSSQSSLAEKSLDSEGNCSKSSCLFTRKKRPALSRRATVGTFDRKPWNYAAGSPGYQKHVWPIGTKKHSLV